MSSDDEVAKLEVQLQKPKAKRAAWRAAEEQQITEEMAATEAKRITKEKVAAEVRWVEEWGRAELEEQRRVMAAAKA